MFKYCDVLYTGAFRFPDQDAAAFRVYGVAKLFAAIGCKVSFAGWEHGPAGVTKYTYNGHECFPQSEFRITRLNPLHRLIGFLFRGWKTIKWICKNNHKYKVIVAYNPPTFFCLLLLFQSKLFGFKVVLDSTEWYESEHLPGGKYGFAAFENWVRMNLVYRMFKDVICISSFLENYYIKRNVIRIPPLLSADLYEVNKKEIGESGIFLIYAGEAGRKDRLSTLIQSLDAIQEKTRTRIVLHIVGMDTQELKKYLCNYGVNKSKQLNNVVCHGRVSREEVLRLYKICHFSVLFRERKRYALAGFPTKATESLVNGCPIITNSVGDLSNILVQNVNALILEEHQLADHLPRLLNRIISNGCYSKMTISSVDTAKRFFSPDIYISSVSRFFTRLLSV